LPVAGRLRRYGPPGPVAAAPVVAGLPRDPLGVPLLDRAQEQRLLAAFAPVLEVDTAGPYDRIGRPYWATRDRIEVDTAHPTVYRRLSHARLDGQVLVQLNYLFWFPERPRKGALDLLGGHLDGFIWRVTLGPDGRPWVYDAIHPCGCYHLFFPTVRADIRMPPASFEEGAFIPQVASALPPGRRMLLRLSSGAHQVLRLSTTGPAADWTPYVRAWMADLRSLPWPGGGYRSLYRPDGLVAGSERRERFLLWPMGIASPGAMRQWGHHATAFIGRRHFDDPDLLRGYFRWAGP